MTDTSIARHMGEIMECSNSICGLIVVTTEYFYKIHSNGNSEYRQHFCFRLCLVIVKNKVETSNQICCLYLELPLFCTPYAYVWMINMNNVLPDKYLKKIFQKLLKRRNCIILSPDEYVCEENTIT